jgi:MoaA/NifB/PqqE/SkfB family radical SAM enzyme
LLQPLDVPLSVVFAYDQSATYSTDRGVAVPADGDLATFGKLSPIRCRQLLNEVESDLGSFRRSEQLARRYYLCGVRSRLLLGETSPNPGCVALNAHLRILPNGDVPTCQFNGAVVGNLARQSFAEVWNGAEVEKQRQWVRSCRGCWAECEVVPSAVYSGDLLRHALLQRRRRAANGQTG